MPICRKTQVRRVIPAAKDRWVRMQGSTEVISRHSQGTYQVPCVRHSAFALVAFGLDFLSHLDVQRSN